MESLDIRYAETPISLGGKESMQRGPCQSQWGSSSSTPLVSEFSGSKSRLRLAFRRCALEPEQSPIPVAESWVKVNLDEVPIFGRKALEESDKFSITRVAASLGKLKLSDNSSKFKNTNENLMNIKEEISQMNANGENTSSLQEHKEFKKHLKKNQRKSLTPNHKSPKVYKVGGSKIRCVEIGRLIRKKINNNKLQKSPKIKSVNKDGPCVKIEDETNLSNKVASTCEQGTGTSGKSSNLRTPTHSGSNYPKLKICKYSYSPKLYTANRARIRQQREQLRKEKEKEMEAKKMKILEEKQRQEEEYILEMRRQTLFKANSIRKYKPLPIVKKRELTDPVSPQISKRRRIETLTQNRKTK